VTKEGGANGTGGEGVKKIGKELKCWGGEEMELTKTKKPFR